MKVTDMSDAVGEFVCGTAGGIIAKAFDFPFDTVKVRMQQTDCKYKGTLECITSTARNEGVRGFYAGIGAPMCGAGFEKAFTFAAYGRASSFYRAQSGLGDAASLPMTGVAFCGAISGLASAMVLTPVELLKCRVQAQPYDAAGKPTLYKGVFDCGVQSVKKEGAKALYNAHFATLLREVPGNAAWFSFYELAMKAFTPAGGTKDDCAWYAFPLSGGVGGFSYWTIFFPADTVKTRMQTDPAYMKMGALRGMGAIYRAGGVAALYRGYGITACRAFPAHGIVFSVYEASTRMWKLSFPKLPKADA
jgi:solute carrier family 25 carnitine/acylcarnitine transporter 20/29